jgi:hypothetical protein
VSFGESQNTFRGKISSSPEPKGKPSTEQEGPTCCILSTGFRLGLHFDPEDGGDMPSETTFSFTGLHGVISHKTLLFKVKHVRN